MIKRYDAYSYKEIEWDCTPAGDWVKWEDVEEILKQKNLLIEKLSRNQRLDTQCININTKEESK
jgi:hypothetical protein